MATLASIASIAKMSKRHAQNVLNTDRCFYRMIWYGGRLRGGLALVLSLTLVLAVSWDETLKNLTTGSYEYKACKLIIYKESSYNPKAKTGSHYGLPQGRSEYLKTATPQQQIIWFTKYVKSRYGSCQAALAFHLKNGYY